MSEQKTVRVRILLAVETSGEWSAFGGQPDGPDSPELLWGGTLGPYATLHWIEADVPVPVPVAELPAISGIAVPYVEGELQDDSEQPGFR
jgi:hypothetical protein